MASTAAIFNGKSTEKTPLTLPETLRATQAAVLWATNAAQCAQEAVAALEAIEDPLAERIEANRQRSDRHHRNGHQDNGNGHHDVALKLTSHGFMRVCKRCGKQVA